VDDSEPEVVVVTRATAGIGRAVVREFARRKAHIGLIARNRARLLTTQREVEEQGGKALPLSVDVADPKAMDEAVAVVNAFGPLDVWVNNAMTTLFAPITEIQPEEYKRATEVTITGN
jgi:NADP-dependent 3-hydroxy acid dehydrogenase YdfG